jgi:hypothetical protein
LLGYALWRAFVAARGAEGLEATSLRSAFMMVLMMALHSQLEYPLWYAYFLLPTALAFGLCLSGVGKAKTLDPGLRRDDGRGVDPRLRGGDKGVGSPWLLAAGLAVAGSGAFVVIDYARVVAIFAPAADAAPLAERIERGPHSVFFAHQADNPPATTAANPADALAPAKRAAHYLLDARLMIAWARAYAAVGDLDRARYIAARLREFRNENAAEFFAACGDEPHKAGVAPPFQCEAPMRGLSWRDFE